MPKYRAAKCDCLPYDNKYTDEEIKFMIFLDKWRREENYNIWPTATQYLAIVKRFLGIAVILLLCQICFADCLTDWNDYPVNGNWRSRAIWANNWLKVDAQCMANKTQRNYQELKKYHSLDLEGQWLYVNKYGCMRFARMVGELRQVLYPNDLIVIGSQ